ncbi:hypothetical protein BDY21DRAFT_293472, partial [Lineolata rhizophorae]
GVLVGGIGGLLRSSRPGLFAAVSGVQWFALGGTFWATRSMLFRTAIPALPHETPHDKATISALAGGITGGSVAALTRGRANVLPATVMFALFCWAGQSAYNALDARHSEAVVTVPAETAVGPVKKLENAPWWVRAAGSKWSPMKIISDEDYARMLEEKLVVVEADIALLDEKIEEAKSAQALQSSKGTMEKQDSKER